MSSAKNYFLATRPQFLPAVIIPVVLGASVSWRLLREFDPFLFILSVLAAVLYHSGMNVLNDYYDYKNGTDNLNKTGLTPFTGGSRFIQNGLLTPGNTLALGVALLASGSAVGLYLAIKTSLLLLAIGIFGLLAGFFYSAPPLFLAGRGLGELTVGLTFGVLTVLGSYVVQTGTISPEALASSLPVSFLIAALVYINEFPDYEADRLAGKRNIVVRLGPERARYGLMLIVAAAYLSIVASAAIGYLPPLSLISLFSAFFAVKGALGLLKHYDGSPRLIPSIKSIILAHLSAGLLLIISNLI